jgi:cytochrome b involved in lipid metabolism
LIDIDEDGFLFFTGDVRGNENPVLQSLHTLFVREHNRKAREIKAQFPRFYGDQEIYNLARRWVVSLIQKITYDEYLPVLLGAPLPAYQGYNENVNPSISILFAGAAFRYGHSAIGSKISRVNRNGLPARSGHLLLRDSFFNTRALREGSMDDILRGVVCNNDMEVDPSFVDDLRNFGPDPPFDLAALNVHRGRDIGLPNYNAVRRFYNLPRLTSFAAFNDTLAASILPTLYSSVDEVELYVAGLIEKPVRGGIVGETFHAIIRDQFERLRNGDRYWYQNNGALSTADRELIQSETLAKVIMRNTNITFFPSSSFRVYDGNFIDGKSTTEGTGQPATSTMSFVPNVYSMKWKTVGTNIEYTFCYQRQGWFGVGFGQLTMANADIIVFLRLNNQLIIREMTASSNAEPTVRSNQVLTVEDVSSAESCVNAAKVVIPISRIGGVSSATRMIYAHGDSHTFAYHGTNRGSLSVSFSSTTSGPIAGPVGVSFVFKLFHGLSMFFVYVFLYPAGVYLARYYSNLTNWVDYHQLMMSIGMTQSLFTVLSIVVANNTGTFMPTVHRILGLIISGLNLITYSLGNSIKLKNSKYYIRYRRKIHIILGYVTCLGGLVNCYFGIGELGLPVLQYTFIGLMVLMGGGIYVVSRYSLSKTNFVPTMNNKKQIPVFEWNDVLERVSQGAKWLVIDGHIYDVEHFMHEHPGGSMILERVLGTDCTEQFGPMIKQEKIEKILGEDMTAIQKTIPKSNANLQKWNSSKFSKSSSSAVVQMHKHSRLAHYRLTSLLVGSIKKDSVKKADNSLAMVSIEESINTALSPVEFKPLKLIKKEPVVTKESIEKVYKFTFAFEHADDAVEFTAGE